MRNSGKSVRRDVAAAKGRQRPVSERPALKKLSQGGTRKVSEGVKKKKKKGHSPGGGLLQSAGVSEAAGRSKQCCCFRVLGCSMQQGHQAAAVDHPDPGTTSEGDVRGRPAPRSQSGRPRQPRGTARGAGTTRLPEHWPHCKSQTKMRTGVLRHEVAKCQGRWMGRIRRAVCARTHTHTRHWFPLSGKSSWHRNKTLSCDRTWESGHPTLFSLLLAYSWDLVSGPESNHYPHIY